jgi:hypothetical protein
MPSTSPQTCLFIFPQNKDSMYLRSLFILHTSLKKRHGLYVMKKDRDKVEKRELEKMSEKSVEQKKRG